MILVDTWGLADAEAAIAGIHDWMENVEWKGPGVDIRKWFVAGHSNGGQGAWYTMMQRNDKVIAGAPIAGYLSIPGRVMPRLRVKSLITIIDNTL
jgi:poly(3-hydroxybutyrate) depolymerase